MNPSNIDTNQLNDRQLQEHMLEVLQHNNDLITDIEYQNHNFLINHKFALYMLLVLSISLNLILLFGVVIDAR